MSRVHRSFTCDVFCEDVFTVKTFSQVVCTEYTSLLYTYTTACTVCATHDMETGLCMYGNKRQRQDNRRQHTTHNTQHTIHNARKKRVLVHMCECVHIGVCACTFTAHVVYEQRHTHTHTYTHAHTHTHPKTHPTKTTQHNTQHTTHNTQHTTQSVFLRICVSVYILVGVHGHSHHMLCVHMCSCHSVCVWVSVCKSQVRVCVYMRACALTSGVVCRNKVCVYRCVRVCKCVCMCVYIYVCVRQCHEPCPKLIRV